MEHRSTLHGSTWCTGCCCTPAAAWAAVLHRAFGDLFPVSGTSHLGLTLHSGPSLRHLQFNTHGSVLTHRLMASKTKKNHNPEGCVPFSHCGMSFLKLWRNAGLLQLISPALTPKLFLSQMVRNGWLQELGRKFQLLQNHHFCVLSVTNGTLVFPLLFNPLNSRARSHKNSFQYLHHRNTPKP